MQDTMFDFDLHHYSRDISYETLSGLSDTLYLQKNYEKWIHIEIQRLLWLLNTAGYPTETGAIFQSVQAILTHKSDSFEEVLETVNNVGIAHAYLQEYELFGFWFQLLYQNPEELITIELLSSAVNYFAKKHPNSAFERVCKLLATHMRDYYLERVGETITFDASLQLLIPLYPEQTLPIIGDNIKQTIFILEAANEPQPHLEHLLYETLACLMELMYESDLAG